MAAMLKIGLGGAHGGEKVNDAHKFIGALYIFLLLHIDGELWLTYAPSQRNDQRERSPLTQLPAVEH